MGREPPSEAASELFARFIGRRDAGEALDLDAFCDEHPARAVELRALHADWVHLREVFAVLGFSATLPDRIRERFGDAVDPEIALVEGEPAGPAGIRESVPRIRNGSQTRYSVRSQLGRGGQGEVMSVWDENLRRLLAMKIVDPRPASRREGTDVDSRKLARMLEEAQITAQLDHPGIVPVHELGLDPANRLFFTMKLVKGENLLVVFDKVRRGVEGWTTTRALGVLLRVCEAMAYAHQKRVIHRDLKPANVMVGRFGEVYVMDWGLARVLGHPDRKDIHLRVDGERTAYERVDTVELLRGRHALERDSPLVTMDGDVVGTPAYMSPEQARGELEQMGPASDVYSVGAILYHLLTGAPPHSRGDETPGNLAILARVLRGPPAPPGEIATDAPPPLIAICDRAMARASSDRYLSMVSLAEDLRAYLEGRVVRAYERGLAAELRHWVRRNRALSAACLLVVVGLGLAAYLQGRRLRDAEWAKWATYVANLPAARFAVERNDFSEAHRYLTACPEEYRGWEWARLSLESDLASQVLVGHSARVTDVEISPDGQHAASASEDGTVRLWGLASGRCESVLGEGGARVNGLVVSQDGSRIYAASADLAIRVWSVPDGQLVDRLEGPNDAAVCLTIDRSGRLAAGCEDGSLFVWDSPATDRTPRKLVDPDSHFLAVHSLCFGAEGKLVSATRQAVQVWNLGTGESETVRCESVAMAAAASGSLAMADMFGSGLQVRAPVAGHSLSESSVSAMGSGHAKEITCLAFDPPGRFLASGSLDRTILVRDMADRGGAISCVLAGHEAAVTALAFGDEGRVLVSGCADGSLRVWRAGARAQRALAASVWAVLGLALVANAEELDILTAEGYMARVDAHSGTLVSRVFEPGWVAQSALTDKWVRHPKLTHGSAALSPDGQLLAMGGLDGSIQLFDARTRAPLATLEGQGARVTGLVFAPEARRLFSSGADGTVRLWDVDTRSCVSSATLAATVPTAIVPLGRRSVLWGSEAGDVGILDLERGRTLASQWSVSGEPIRALAVDPSATRVACASSGIDLWDLERRTKLLELRPEGRAETAQVSALAFSGDGERLVAGTEDGEVVLWETRVDGANAWSDGWNALVPSLYPQLEELRASQGVLKGTAGTMARELLQQNLFVNVALTDLVQRQDLSASLRDLVAQELHALGDLGPEQLLEIALSVVTEHERSNTAYQRARLAAETASLRQPENALALATLGAAQLRLGETSAALATCDRALELQQAAPGADSAGDDSAFVHAFRGLCLARQDRAGAATQELATAREQGQGSSSQQLLGCIAELEGALSPR